MALNSDDPNSSTRPKAPDFYLAYLNSPSWRQTRNSALRRAKWTCHRCQSRRDLEVHHLSYDRLGAEMSSDLEVLCFTCHNKHHREEAETQPIGIYLRVVSEVVQRSPWARLADVAEDAKQLCADRKIPNKPELMHKAISLVCGTRLKDRDTRAPYVSVVEVDSADVPPMTHAQAVELLMRLPMTAVVPIKTMPCVRLMTQREADRLAAFEMITREMEASIARCEELEAKVED